MRKIVITAVMAAMLLLGTASMAFANHKESVSGSEDFWGDRTRFSSATYSSKCVDCHGDADGLNTRNETKGPHGGYTTTSNNCQACHRVHNAKSDLLLPGTTVVAVCNYCHDLSGSLNGPYNMVGFSANNDVKGAHRIAGLKVNINPLTTTNDKDVAASAYKIYQPTTEFWNAAAGAGRADFAHAAANEYNLIPGGNNTTGDPAAGDWSTDGTLAAGNFTCDSCHTPHALPGKAVKPYLGDSHVKSSLSDVYDQSAVADASNATKVAGYKLATYVLSNRLLKVRPNNVGADVADYGSAWCLACHQGRDASDVMTKNSESVYNHPVNKTAPGYHYLDDVQADLVSNGVTFPAATTDSAPVDIEVLIQSGLSTDFRNPAAAGGDVLSDETDLYLHGYHPAQIDAKLVVKEDLRNNKWYVLTPNDAATPGNDARDAGTYVDFADFQNADPSLNGPSCQQCHANARDVESTWEAGGEPDNMTFPHISKNKALLVETGDDFCTNCHGTADLP